MALTIGVVVGLVQIFANDAYSGIKDRLWPTVKGTEVINYAPVNNGHLATGISIGKTGSGTCDREALITEGAAMRCSIKDQGFEPCYWRDVKGDRDRYICVMSPWEKKAIQVVIPEGWDTPGIEGPQIPKEERGPWGVEVQDPGNREKFYRCLAITGAAGSAGGEPTRYICWNEHIDPWKDGYLDEAEVAAYGTEVERKTQGPWMLPIAIVGGGSEVRRGAIRRVFL
ncbi:hypothetical protein ACFV0T_11310 [Streptomyces sp. NPDC059582]|uniref:hypothetical protein n=1 Tax=Streptomyces sp. NPDC059582 TaxID=3346875 RepID=UPI0036A9224D